MARRRGRDMTIEEFDAWSASRKDVSDELAASAEEGGPRVSFVPVPSTVPLDFLPDEVEVAALVVGADGSSARGPRAVAFDPEASRKLGG